MKTTASFVQPAVGGTVTVAVDDSTSAAEGQSLLIPDFGHYMVTTISDASHVTMMSVGLRSDALPGVQCPRGSGFVPSAPPGLGGPVGATFPTFPFAGGPFQYTATSANESIGLRTASVGAISVFLLDSPPDGAAITMFDVEQNAATNNIMVQAQGGMQVQVPGAAPASSVTLSRNGVLLGLVFSKAAGTWLPVSYFPGL